MPGPIAEGFVSIHAQLAGFRREVQREVATALQGVRARVEIQGHVGVTQLRQEVQRAARAAERGQRVTVGVRINPTGLRAELQRAMRIAERGQVANVGVHIDSTGLRAEINRAARIAERGQNVAIGAKVDSAGLRSEVRRAAAVAGRGIQVQVGTKVDGRPVAALRSTLSGVRNDASQAGGALSGLGGPLRQIAAGGALILASWQLLKFPALVTGMSLAVGAAGALSAALIGLAASLSSVAGLGPAAAVGISALGQGLGVAVGAFGGIKEAVKGYVDDQKAIASSSGSSASAAASSAKAQEAAAQAVEDAQRGVADAHRQVAEQVRTAARQVTQAEEDLADAQLDSVRAQERLTDARREAAEELEDLRLSTERSLLSEEQARLRLEEAAADQVALEAELAGNETVEAMRKRRQAALDYADAELSLREAQEQRVDQVDELSQAERVGIDGSRQVVAAQEDVRDANARVADAQEALVESQRSLTLAQEDGARRIEDANRQLARAMSSAVAAAEELGGSGAQSVSKFAQAMEGLSPAAQAFARQLIDVRSRLLEVRNVAAEALFPGVSEGLDRVLPLLDLFQPAIRDTATLLGSLVNEFAKVLVQLGPELLAIFEGNIPIIRSLGLAFINILPGIVALLHAAQPLALWLARMAETWAANTSGALQAAEASGRLATFFENTRTTTEKLFRIVGNLVGVFRNVFTAARPLGDWILDNFTRLSARARELTGSLSGQNALRRFFDDARPALEEAGRLVLALGRGLGSAFQTLGPQLAPLLRQLRTELLPVILQLVGSLSGGFASALISLATQAARFFGVFATASPVLVGIVRLVGLFLGAAVDLKNALGPVGDVLVNIISAISILGAARGIFLVVRGFRELYSAIFGLTSGLTTIQGLFVHLGGSTDSFTGRLLAAAPAVLKFASVIGIATLGGFALGNWLNHFGQNDVPIADSALGRFTGSLALVQGAMAPLPGLFAGASASSLQLDSAQRLADSSARGHALAQEDNAARTKLITQAANDAVAAIRGLSTAQEESINSEFRLNNLHLQVEQSQVALTAAIRDNGVGSLEARTAQEALAQAVFAASQEEAKQFGEFQRLNPAIASSQTVTDFLRESLLRQAETIGGPVAEQLRNLAAHLSGAQTQGGFTREEMDRVRASVLGIPDREIKITTLGAAEAARLLGAFAADSGNILASIPGARIGGPVGGVGSGDIVPTMLEPGEFVIRKAVVRSMGLEWMRALNAGVIQGRHQGGMIQHVDRPVQQFATGGIVMAPPATWRIILPPPPAPASSGPTSGPGAGVEGLTAEANRLLQAILDRFPGQSLSSGYRSPEHNAAVGGVPGSDHTKGQAIDISPGSSAVAEFARAWPTIKQVLWQVAGHFDHVHAAVQFLYGGLVPGVGRADTVPAMLAPREFVVQAPAVDRLGLDALRSINRGVIPETDDSVSRFVREAGKPAGGDGGSMPSTFGSAPYIGSQTNEHHWHIAHPPDDVEGLSKRAASRMASLVRR